MYRGNRTKPYCSLIVCQVIANQIVAYNNLAACACLAGSGVNLLLITPEKAIKLVGNDFFRHFLRNEK